MISFAEGGPDKVRDWVNKFILEFLQSEEEEFHIFPPVGDGDHVYAQIGNKDSNKVRIPHDIARDVVDRILVMADISTTEEITHMLGTITLHVRDSKFNIGIIASSESGGHRVHGMKEPDID